MTSQWHRLHLTQKGLPPLLFQYTWTRQGYEVYITDLTFIWSERLSHKAIAKRAEEDATTIDPGEDPEQLTVLLEKIQKALQEGNKSAIISSGTQPDSLQITTTTKLPAPLKPLKWSFILSKQPLSSLTSHLLIPLLREEAQWESRQQSLLNQIKHKDYVLGKLFDKMEILGVDLGSVFPSAAGSRASRKAITRLDAARFVKGIAPFDEQTWLAEAGLSKGAGLATNLFQEISESGDSHGLDALIHPQGEWWHQLARPGTSAREPSPAEQEARDSEESEEKPSEPKHLDTGGDTTASSDDEEFQRQEIPPGLKGRHTKDKTSPPKQKPREKRHSSPILPSDEDEATASDSDSEPEPAPRQKRIPHVSKSPISSPPAIARDAPKRPTGGLGMIGGKKKQETKPSPSPPPSSPMQARETPNKTKGGLGKIGGKSKKEAEPQPQPSPSPSSSPPLSPPAQARKAPKTLKGGLGVIGGKKKQTKEVSPSPGPSSPVHASTEDEERILPTSSALPTAKTKRSGKLGMIGGKAKAKPSEPTQDKSPQPTSDTVAMSPEKASTARSKDERQTATKEESPLPTPAIKPAPPAEPETEAQRADRKREELKRSLEAKSKAPAKKKRRF